MKPRLLTNARFYTLDPHTPVVDTILIDRGIIQFTGSLEDLDFSIKESSQIEDLDHAYVLPGFSDAHIHLLEYGLSLQRVDCETRTRSECIKRVRESVETAKPGEWVLGHGWNQNIWPEGEGTKEMLDKFSSNNPVYLTHKSLHSGWANSAALTAAGIRKHTENPKGGVIERNEENEPTGIVFESAMRLVESAIPAPTPSQRRSALENAQRKLLSFGITAVHDFDAWECYQTLREMEIDGTLKIRVIKSIPYPRLEEAIEENLLSGSGSDWLRIGWLKLFSDGALGPQTAAMLKPFEGSNSTGMLFLTRDDVVEIGRKAMKAGISLAIHAIGDRANREVIHGYAQLSQEGWFDHLNLLPRIEHVQLIEPNDIKQMAAVGITASMQPIHAVSDRDMADKYWGKRCENAYAWKSVLETGTRLIFGSDAPVESPNPFWGLSAAIDRTSPGNLQTRKSWYPEQCLSLAQALNAYIQAPYEAANLGNCGGKLAEGYSADLVLFEKDIFKLDSENLPKIQPIGCMTAGEWNFRK